MEELKTIVYQEKEVLPEVIIRILEHVCNNGDSMLIKSDGLRDSLKYTVVITGGKNRFDPIRFDADTLDEAIRKVLKEYLKFLIPNKPS
jgi:hypothetical protein